MAYPSIDNPIMKPPAWLVDAQEVNRTLVRKIEALDLVQLLDVKSLKACHLPHVVYPPGAVRFPVSADLPSPRILVALLHSGLGAGLILTLLHRRIWTGS